MNSLVSVIVPIYNTEKYLNRCIDSIINQSYKNLEIILIDDGSTDNSFYLCKEYAKEDKRISFYHQKNKGLSFTRNKGISLSKGMIISFIDSDDFVDQEFIKILIDNMEKENADISGCAYNFTLKGEKNKQKNIILSKEEALSSLLSYNYNFGLGVCNKLFKKKLFNNLFFPINKTHEDICILGNLIIKSQKIVTTNLKLYHYILRNDSISRTFHNSYDLVIESEKLKKIVNNDYKILNKEMDMFIICNRIYLCNYYLENKNNNEYIFETKYMIKKHILDIILVKYPLKRKAQIIIFIFNLTLYLKINKKYHQYRLVF
jgi:glycosyltransferase involved in cell wall biosynthesis